MKKTILYVVLVLITNTIYAQDNNYWNQMPGSLSGLLGGAVVAGDRDNSAVFYNPGALGFIDSNTISISATGYQYEMEKIINGAGIGIDLTSSKFQTVPLVSISGVFKTNKKSKSTFGFMLFTKNQTSNNFTYRFDGNKDTSVLAGDNYRANNPTVEYIGEYNLQTALNELWGGVTYSYQINKHISVGASPFVAYRTQSLSKSFIANVFMDSSSNFYNKGGVGVGEEEYDDIENITLSNIRALGKIGIDFDYGNLKFGATFTTPSINLGGNATIERHTSYNGGYASVTGDTIYPNFAVNDDRQQDLKTTYKSPFSVSAGIEYHFNKTTISFTGEYFGAVAAYSWATPASAIFARPLWLVLSSPPAYPFNADQFLRIIEASKSVTNYALAIQQEITNKISLAASFRTDYTSYQKASVDFWQYLNNYGYEKGFDTQYPTGQQLSFSNVNLYHITLGIIIKNKKSDLHLGVGYTFGTNSNFQPLTDIANPLDNGNYMGMVPDYQQTAIYKYSSFSVLLGYTYHLK